MFVAVVQSRTSNAVHGYQNLSVKFVKPFHFFISFVEHSYFFRSLIIQKQVDAVFRLLQDLIPVLLPSMTTPSIQSFDENARSIMQEIISIVKDDKKSQFFLFKSETKVSQNAILLSQCILCQVHENKHLASKLLNFWQSVFTQPADWYQDKSLCYLIDNVLKCKQQATLIEF